MSGERHLETLLRSLSPALAAEEFVFCSVPSILGEPVCAFREAEGWTLVLRRAEAERLGLPYAVPSRLITLTVHSDLESVGLLAAVTAALAEAGIAANVVSGFYHDHLFVPADRAAEALEVLVRIERRSRT